MRRILALLALVWLAGCNGQEPAALPTLAVIPTFTASPVPSLTSGAVTAVVGVPTPTAPGTDVPIAGELRADEPQGGVLDSASPRQLFTFEGQAGQIVSIRMERISGSIDPVLTLISPDGEALAVDDNSGGGDTALLRNVPLPVDGVYSVQAFGKDHSGGFTLTLSFGAASVTPVFTTATPMSPFVEILTPTLATAVSGRNQLVDHVPLIGTLSESDLDRYALFASAGERITVGVSPLGDLRPLIQMIGPDGDVLASASSEDSAADGDALIANFPIRVTASYVILVTGEDGTTGDYIISYGRGVTREDVMRGRLTSDETYSGSIVRRGLREVWSVFLNAGDVIAAAAAPADDTFDPLLEFALAEDETPDDSRDNIIATDDNSGGDRTAFIGQATAPQTGLYHLRIAAAGAASIGSYTLVWRYINAAPTPTPIPGVVPLFTMRDSVPESTYHFYPFQGRAGQMIQVRVVATTGSTLDPVAVLLDASGAEIASADDSDGTLNPRFTVTLPENGTYMVRVNGYLSGGEFELTVEMLFPLNN